MEAEFWHEKWEIKQIGFHLDYVHPILKRRIGLFNQQQTVLVPLCGKTLDIGYLLEQGNSVVAAELSEIAISELFQQLGLTPTISAWKEGKKYQAGKLTVYVGDFFALDAQGVGEIAWVYDRAAIVALPEELRVKYAQHLMTITNKAPQLLLTLDYDQNVAGGPPFAVSGEEVTQHYNAVYSIELLEEADIIEEEPRFKAKGLNSFYQRAYHLTLK